MTHICRTFLCLAIMLSNAAIAEPIPTIGEYLAASEKFKQLTLEAEAHSSMPRISNDEVKKVLGILSDDRVLTSQKFAAEDLGVLINICGKTNEVIMSYGLYDLKNRLVETSDQAALTLQIQNLMFKNIVEYQDELAKLQPFLVRCLATQLPVIIKFGESLPAEQFTALRREGAIMARNGAFGMYFGAITSSTNAQIKEEHQIRLLTALAETSQVFASSLTNDQRKQITELVNVAIQHSSSAYQKPLITINKGMNDQTCTFLCRL
jgi:hypothetical protein